MQYPSTIEPNFYAYYNNRIIYALSDSDDQYSCGNKVNVTKDNCPFIYVNLCKVKDGSDNPEDNLYIKLYLDYLISVGDSYSASRNSFTEPCNGGTYFDALVDLQKRDITEMVLQGYSKDYIESVIPYYLKTTTTDIGSDNGVIVSGYSPYIYLRNCEFYAKEGGTPTGLITENNPPINLDDAELWKDIALSEAQKTADKILTLGGQETCELEWVSNESGDDGPVAPGNPVVDGDSTQTPTDGLADDPTIVNPPDDVIDNPGTGGQHD